MKFERTPGPRRLRSPNALVQRGVAACVVVLMALGGAASAAPLTVGDFDGGEEGQATAILVRSLLAEAGASPAQDGAAAPGAGSGPQRIAASITSTEDELRADFRVEEGGRRLWAARATAAPGDVTALAAGIARTVAQRQGLKVGSSAVATLGELRPYARAAAALAHGDGRQAAAALVMAEPQVARKLSGARAIAARVLADASLPVASRLRAARLSGQYRAALALLAGKRNPDAAERAERARIRIASGSPDEVAKAAGELRGDPDRASPELVVARAELAAAEGGPDAAAAVGALLRPLVTRPEPDPGALLFVLGLAPRFLDGALEGAVIDAARRLADAKPEMATLAGQLALRALHGGALGPSAVSLVRVEDLGASELATVERAARAEPTGGMALEHRIAGRAAASERLQRTASPSANVAGDEAGPAIAVRIELPDVADDGSGGDRAPVSLPPELLTPEAAEAAGVLVPLLSAFPSLADKNPLQVLVARQRSEWSLLGRLYRPSEPHIELGLRRAVGLPPYAKSSQAAGGETLGVLATRTLRELASGTRPPSDLVLIWRADTDGEYLDLQLTLFDAGTGTALVHRALVRGGDVTYVNVVLAVLLGALLLALLGAALWVFVLAGRVEVDLVPDPGVERQVIAVRLSRSAERPSIDAADFDRRHAGRHVRGFREHIEVERGALFRLVRTGAWWVHVYGVQVRGGEPRALGPHLSRATTVRLGRGAYLSFDLRVAAADYCVLVMDGPPRPNTPVWIDEARDRAVRTNANGEAMISVPLGAHRIRVDAGDIVAEKWVTVINSRSARVTIDAGFERRVARIEIPEEDPALSTIARRGRHDARPSARAPAFPPTVRAPAAVADALAAMEVSFDFDEAGEGHARTVQARPPAAQIVPRTLGSGRYRLIAELGRGAMGVVFRAHDEVLGREVAVKVLADEQRRNQGMLQLFLQEARAMAALNHPNLVTVFDQGQDAGEAFMVMELIDGRSLAQVLAERGTLPWPQVVGLGEQLCAGLAYAHERRILHRDIKPGNVFLTRSGLLKLGDFGLARAVEKQRITQTNVSGTPAYMSPEQIRGADIDFRSDLYAVGCTLFEMLTGRLLFEVGEPMFHHMYTEPPDPRTLEPSVPPALSAAVLSCLRKDKDARVSSALALREALHAITRR